jgi:hypothetical protein
MAFVWMAAEEMLGLDGSHPNAEALFWTENAPNQWLCCNFREMGVHPTHCTLRVSGLGFNWKSWVAEGSLDGEK